MNHTIILSFNDELEKLAAHAVGHPGQFRKKRKLDIGSGLAAGLGSWGAYGLADKHIKPGKLKNPKVVAATLLAGLAAGEGYRSYRSSSRKRELRRRGSELQTYMREMRKVKRAAGVPLEKISSKKKRGRMLGLGAGLGALGIGGLLLSRGRRASSGIGKATESAKALKVKLEQQTRSIQAGNQKAEKLLREAKAERAHTDSMLSSLKDRGF